MNSEETLLAMDFDDTIIDGDSSEAAIELAPEGELPKELQSIRPQVEHATFMGAVFGYLRQQGITAHQILAKVRMLKFAPGMQEVFFDIYNSEQEAIIISDANSVFIDSILQHKNLNNVIPKYNVYTNPACVNPHSHQIRIQPYECQRQCDLCPPNLCKGQILMRHISKRRANNLKTFHIVYVGDGVNDYCPCMRLGSNDIIFCRKKFALEQLLQCELAKPEEEKRLYAEVRFYTDAFAIRDRMRIDNVFFPARTMTPPTVPSSTTTPCNPSEDSKCEEEEEEEEETTSSSSSDAKGKKAPSKDLGKAGKGGKDGKKSSIDAGKPRKGSTGKGKDKRGSTGKGKGKK
ncbi:unnamed protein product [Notodromas monacha]|uniref:Uncharacterized protein n=1 Tax=Notodromas monacha TaxID=399045 RepID=A0A7R9BNG4_9CRUS|nr:unnamed protein product [Notodromas monacha]CAG0918749.1 unnamed protein product [Notodromas monacha]